MPVHDAYARVTPAELSFPDGETAEARFRSIAQEVESRGADAADPAAFVMFMETGRALRELRGPEDDPGRIREHGVLLYHLFHAWREDAPTYLLDTRVVRFLVESGPWDDGVSAPPGPAGYVQLPQHLVWVRSEATSKEGEAGVGTPESVDGLFWTVWEDAVSFLPVMGIRPDRPGFGVVPMDPVPLERLGGWLDTDMRDEGDDFASAMPGAELERLYELRTAGEVLKLGGRILHYLATAASGARTAEEHPAGGRDLPSSGPRPSSRPSVRVTLEP